MCAPSKKLVVELDGSLHLLTEVEDAERTAFLNAKGYRVIRFTNREIAENVDSVLDKIRHALETR
ncbi:MAG: DUF559 domain-containing protein [Chloroflexota bacterium]